MSGSLTHTAQVTLVVSNPSGCATATGGHGWINTSFSSQNGTFTVEFDATPSASHLNAVVALSNGPHTAYAGFANLVAFNGKTSTILARNGGVYSATIPIHYAGGQSYHFRMQVNIPAHTYSISVTPPDGLERMLGSGFAFRTEQNRVRPLNSWGAFVGAPSGAVTVCNFAVQ
jgi:hypothetical protein